MPSSSTVLPAHATPVFDLGRYADSVALDDGGRAVTYDELAGRVQRFAAEHLGPARRLVLIEIGNDLGSVVAYLAAVQYGHVALLVPAGRERQNADLVEAYDPDVIVGAGSAPNQRRAGSAHDLHPDLALLLSTSGTTGSPKLVRLSVDNLRANAASIAAYLRLSASDCAITSLPLHYCYGLSVLNSHLHVGARVALTSNSVVDPCFWETFERAGATSLAGVPHTFDLLENSGFTQRQLPTLRLITQAGGKLAPERVRAWARQGRERGWEFFVMYGATEATARMAYLPPGLAELRPDAIGVPIPGGAFRIDPVDGIDPADAARGVGELVYVGDNVMLGYATQTDHLALGRQISELRTGDLAHERDGLYHVVGRLNRYAKLAGLRIDLDRVESQASLRGQSPVRCVASGRCLAVFTTGSGEAADLQQHVADLCGLPCAMVQVNVLPELPVTASGKPDYKSLAGILAAAEEKAAATADGATRGVADLEVVAAEYAVVLGRTDITAGSTFVDLGGDSLSYVELATRLSRRLDSLPSDWHVRTIEELIGAGRRRRRGVSLDVTVLLRAVAIVAIVGTHANLFTVVGGAHLLLVVAGFNVARFQVVGVSRGQRVRRMSAALAQIAVPTTVIIGAISLLTGFYRPATAIFLNGVLSPNRWTVDWQLWFIEALVWICLAATALMAVPAIDRWERRAPFGFALTAVVVLLALRYAWVGLEAGTTERYTPGLVAWLFAAGWLVQRAGSPGRRWLAVGVVAVGMVGFFGEPWRELFVVVGVAVLAAAPVVRVPALLGQVVGVVASASLFVYLTHWQVYPHLEDNYPLAATVSSFAVGIAVWWVTKPLMRRLAVGIQTSRLMNDRGTSAQQTHS